MAVNPQKVLSRAVQLLWASGLDDLLGRALQAALDFTEADWGHVILRPRTGENGREVGLDRNGDALRQEPGSGTLTLLQQTMTQGRALRLSSVDGDHVSPSIPDPAIHTAVCAPIVQQGVCRGALLVAARFDSVDLGEEALHLVAGLADLIGMGLDPALQRETAHSARPADGRDVLNRVEEIDRVRLQLWEYSTSHALEAVMQRALDEICHLTDSPIGFYHFVEPDQKSLCLQAWSTRTLAEFCQAAGKGLHYPVDQAGVWADAFHQRRPVIHNDYGALPHKRGMPEGHAQVTRQLVVPVLREDRVEAILGVGNKPAGYDDHDVALVSTVADLVWNIVDHKRSEERIRELNDRLRAMAMTDELTGILNRRAFFERGKQEFKRFERHQAPFSILMLDIDDFKQVNDSYGHDAGDRLLQDFTDALKPHIRGSDVFARVGGEEFCILLPHTLDPGAETAAEKLRRLVEETSFSVVEQAPLRVTVSIGVATTQTDMASFEAVIKKADAALYRAKREGRNQVVRHGHG